MSSVRVIRVAEGLTKGTISLPRGFQGVDGKWYEIPLETRRAGAKESAPIPKWDKWRIPVNVPVLHLDKVKDKEIINAWKNFPLALKNCGTPTAAFFDVVVDSEQTEANANKTILVFDAVSLIKEKLGDPRNEAPVSASEEAMIESVASALGLAAGPVSDRYNLIVDRASISPEDVIDVLQGHDRFVDAVYKSLHDAGILQNPSLGVMHIIPTPETLKRYRADMNQKKSLSGYYQTNMNAVKSALNPASASFGKEKQASIREMLYRAADKFGLGIDITPNGEGKPEDLNPNTKK